jgi:hypothetical protein
MKQNIKTVIGFKLWLKVGDLKRLEDEWNTARVIDALDDCVKAAERYELLRTLTPQEFKQLWQDNISGKGYFDELVDKMIEARK